MKTLAGPSLRGYPADLLRLGVRLALAARPGKKVIAVVGMTPGAGVSTLLVLLGRILASQDPPVTLVDANPTSPRLHELLNARPIPGVIDVATPGAGLERALQTVSRGQLQLLPAGDWRDAPQVMSPARWANLLERLRSRGERVLVDAGTVDGVNVDGVLTASDGVMLLLESGRSRWEQVAAFSDRMGDLGVPFLGVAVNKRRYTLPGFIYRRL